MDLIIVFGTLLLLLLITYYVVGKRAKPTQNLPPGPSGVPILGYLPFLTPNRYVALAKLSRRYGEVMSVPFFTTRCIVLSSYEILQEAFVNQGDTFAARPQFRFINSFMENTGIVCTDGEKWREHRRFALRTLRDFGFGKSLSLAAVHHEVHSLVSQIEAQDGDSPIDTMALFSRMTANVICSLVFGDRVASEDEEFPKAKEILDELIACDSRMFENIPLYFPWVMDIPFFMKFFSKFAVRESLMRQLVAYIQQKVVERMSTIQTITEPRDFTDAILLHKLALEEQGQSAHTFDTRSIAGDMVDLFGAGTDTTAVTLTWACLLIALHPQVGVKVRSEVLEMIGSERLVTMQDRPRLHYTQAVLDEVSRFASIVPTGLVHRTATETTLNGYFIPADVLVSANLYAVHMDPDVWRNPNQFDPGHFLDEKGAYKPRAELIPFSLGKRACLGESLARMELFVFFVSVIQRYDIMLEKQLGLNVEQLLMGTNGLVRHIDKHGIIFKRLE